MKTCCRHLVISCDVARDSRRIFLPFLLSFSPVLFVALHEQCWVLPLLLLSLSFPPRVLLVALYEPTESQLVLSSLLLLSSLIILVPGLHMDRGCRSRKCLKVFFLLGAVGARVHVCPPHLQMWSFLCFCALTYEGDPPTMQLSCRNLQEPRESTLLGCRSPCVVMLFSTQQRRQWSSERRWVRDPVRDDQSHNQSASVHIGSSIG